MLLAVSASILVFMLIGFATRNLIQPSHLAPRDRRYRVGHRNGASELARCRVRSGFSRG